MFTSFRCKKTHFILQGEPRAILLSFVTLGIIIAYLYGIVVTRRDEIKKKKSGGYCTKKNYYIVPGRVYVFFFFFNELIS